MNLPSNNFWAQLWGSSWPLAELRRRVCFLVKTHGHLPSSSARQNSFPMTEALLTRCRRLAVQNTCRFAEITHTFFQSKWRMRDCVQALRMKFAPCCRRWGGRGKSANKSARINIKRLDYDCVASERKNYRDCGRFTFLTPLHQTLPNRIASLLHVARTWLKDEHAL